MGDASWLGAAGGGGPMAAAAADAEERAERLVGLLPGGGGRPLCDILQWELRLDQKRKVVVRGQERWRHASMAPIDIIKKYIKISTNNKKKHPHGAAGYQGQ